MTKGEKNVRTNVAMFFLSGGYFLFLLCLVDVYVNGCFKSGYLDC